MEREHESAGLHARRASTRARGFTRAARPRRVLRVLTSLACDRHVTTAL